MNSPPSPLKAAQFLNHRYKEVLQQDLKNTSEIIHQSNQERNMVQNQSDIYSVFKVALATLDREDEKLTANLRSPTSERVANFDRERGFWLRSISNRGVDEPFAQLQSSPETSLSAQQNKLLEIASNLTETNQQIAGESEHTISQIGDYQFWRDLDNVAVVKASSSELIAYGDNRGLFPELANPNKTNNLSSNSNNLLDKIKQQHPKIETNYQLSSVAPAYNKFKYEDPLIQASNSFPPITQKKDSLSQSLSKAVSAQLNQISKGATQAKTWLNNTFDSLSEQVRSKSTQCQQEIKNWAKERVQKTASHVLSQRLIKQAHQKFWTARKRTGESEYSIGDYKINRDETGKYQIKDRTGESLAIFSQKYDPQTQRSQLTVSSHTLNSKKLALALRAIGTSYSSAVGSPQKETIYHNKLKNIVKQVSQRVNGVSTLEKGEYLIEKNHNNITIKSPQGATLISATSQGVNSQISLDKIKQINQTIKQEKQQKRVETIAPLLVDYLNLNRSDKIDKANFSIEYNSNDQTLTFENHKNPLELLKAQLKDDKWLDLGSSISQSEESRFTERVAPKLKKAFLERQHHLAKPKIHNKSQARSL